MRMAAMYNVHVQDNREYAQALRCLQELGQLARKIPSFSGPQLELAVRAPGP
jgi:hypothetical protein